MIGIDTNVLVRYLVQDDAAQSATANDFMERRLTVDEPGYLSVVVMAETAWVLERRYGWSGQALAGILEQVLQADVLVVEHEQEVAEAVSMLNAGLGSFSDALVSAMARQAGCIHTVTFDRRALRLPGFAPVETGA